MCSSLKGEAGIHINCSNHSAATLFNVQARKNREGFTEEVMSEMNFEKPVTFFQV